MFKETEEPHNVYVRYEFESNVELENVKLAAERMENCKVCLNGVSVDGVIDGYYVDEAIQTISLPKVQQGKNVLELQVPFSASGNLEACYLLGEFDVSLKGCNATLHAASDTIGFAPLAMQGMPFYGGNVVYRTQVTTPKCMVRISVTEFGAPCVRVKIDGEDAGLICFAPFAIEKELSEGTHIIEFCCYGNRNNTFGPVHNKRMTDMDYYIEPIAWEPECEFWRSGYFFQNTGILSGPVLEYFI